MSITIGLVANIYNEASALPGWLETHLPFFDDVRVLHAGPGGEYSYDGTMEILEKWHVPTEFCSIDDGFGVVRSRALRMSPCDYIMLLDADERFYPTHRILTCEGVPTLHSEVDAILRTYDFRDLSNVTPDWNRVSLLGAGLTVNVGIPYDQGTLLRNILNDSKPDAVVTIRRHWHDFSWRRPTQHWLHDPDWQMRLVRNDPSIYFDPAYRMHERLVGAGKTIQSDLAYGPFFDHFHFAFKRMEVKQRAHDVAVYDAIHKGETPPTWEKFRSSITATSKQ